VTDDDSTSGLRPESRRDEDDRLWQELAAVIAEASPVPPEVIQRGRDSFTWRTIDVELAELAGDSADSHSQAAVVRASRGPRSLTFEAPGLTVQLEVTDVGTRRRLIGQLIPAQRAVVTVRHQHGETVATEADELGRFRADDVPAGLSSLRCHLAGTGEDEFVVTDWIRL
jgi:hypothetical protein